MPFLPFIIILMLISGLPGFMIWMSPEMFKADPLSTAMFMSGLAFALCWVTFFALFKMNELKHSSELDRSILDFWQNHPAYIVRKEFDKWICYNRKNRVYCEGDSLRSCLSFAIAEDARSDYREAMYDLKVGEKGLMEFAEKETGFDIAVGYTERDISKDE